MKIKNARIWVTPTKNPLRFLMGTRIDKATAQSANLSHAGMASAILMKDELNALIGIGFKPFARANLEVDLYEDEAYDYSSSSRLHFDLKSVEFQGGIGKWETLLENIRSTENPQKHWSAHAVNDDEPLF